MVGMCCYDIAIKVVSKETTIKGFWWRYKKSIIKTH